MSNTDEAPVKSRGWIVVTNNPTLVDEEEWDLECVAKACGREIGEQGTPHLQGAIYFKNARTLSSMKKKFKRAHLEVMRGTWNEAKVYALKDANILVDVGDGPSQGQREDLLTVKRRIDEGASLLDCYEEDFATTAKFSRAFKEYADLKRRKLYRTEETKGIWYYGVTGTGKSHKAFENFDPDTTYVMEPADHGWWDGYEGESTVIINEFRGEISYQQLLSLTDKWPKKVSRRNREPTPFLSKNIIITSAIHPRDVYREQVTENDKIDQLLRRFEIVKLNYVYQEE
jgi:hypothetical protein